VSGGSVYFKNDINQFLRVATGGGQVTILGSGYTAYSVRLSGANLYFVDGGAPAVGYVPANGGNATVLTTNNATGAGDLASDGSYVYWIVNSNPGRVNRVGAGGGGMKT